ncbi:MAG: adenylosuccinate lyase [Candidatus Omnitrophica bacterium CG08_land_8_20_14_0_20_41_16]|uniref:Adenylosuccinate lyase n=1 Tax=Candidatus Sherwoodlollariibacterium unditelluris TaxID=1974757 RepID=A0A2G9YL26_9BACT|nr:MAG: adenylosuccinate lyase [Candidatus Omnitrophica bacterium CG23_combo_of_CG06-09_8_20_14_all_41_10]PIS33965.1 MAG: adenylosuccinate lyase [Candidatus Omnitrophica bacterium CG08_land_8_20_14_0_20_41_16]
MIERYSLPKMKIIWQEEFKFKTMLDIEILAIEALAKLKKVPAQAVKRIRKKAKFNLAQINKIEEKTQHDVVAFITNVAQHIGNDARYLHLGLTSSDILDTTLGVQLKAAAEILVDDINRLLKALAKKAKIYKDTACIGRTHGVHAEPTTFGLKLALWYDEMQRNLERLRLAKEEVSVGKLSGAVGTYSNIEPQVENYVCRKLGLKPARISTQIIQRDIYAVFMASVAIIGSSLEKFATEIRHLQRTEILEAEEQFSEGQKGSSAMPHKRNPVICERICGLSRLLRGNALAAMENVALWHERDISHSSVERVIIPDSTLALDYMLNKFIQVINDLTVYPEHMMANLIKTRGLIFSQRVLLNLMDRGMSRLKAYDLVQHCAMRTWKEEIDFKNSLMLDSEVSKYLNEKEIDKIFDLNYYLRKVNMIFSRVGL